MFNNEPTQQSPMPPYLAQTPPSTTPSPGQHQQYHLAGPQPSPAGGGPQYAQATTQAPQFQMMCPVITAPIQQYYPGGGQSQHHPQQFQVLMPPSHPAQ